MMYLNVNYMIFFMMIFFFLSMYFYYYDFSLILEWQFISLNSTNLEMLLYLDWVSSIFISIVLLISSMVLLYSMVYMSGDKFINRYYLLVLLFVFSMALMIISPNLVSIMFGWDGLGLVSFCLVIYYQNYSSYNSGMLTVLMNRVGDVMILMIIGIAMMYGSWNICMLKDMNLMLFFLIIAGMTKSAQIPFSVWLPSAMAAPTPVSALVHSSTLVTAGVYLLIRFNNFFMSSMLSKILLILSVLTMFMSGLMANFEYDLKKIIALSTLSQLGLMMMILSIGFPLLSYYHLMTHAIFKSLLFMSAGVIIHSMGNNQDIRLMGGLNEFIPFTMYSFNLTLLALCGFPFMSGFYSKDTVMEMIYLSNFNIFMFIMAIISLMFTVFYSIRLMKYSFFKEFKLLSCKFIIEDKIMNLSMMILMIMSILIGSMLNWMFFIDEMIYLDLSYKLLTFMVILISSLFMVVMDFGMFKKYNLSYFFSTMWFMAYLFMYVINPVMKTSSLLYYNDKVWIEFFSKIYFLNLFIEYKNKFMNYKYKIFMFIYWLVLIVLILHM
nr:NADH dehydrogenase subunit 5 [Hypoponera sauteri]